MIGTRSKSILDRGLSVPRDRDAHIPSFAKRFQVSELELAAHASLGKYDMDFLITLSKTNAATMKVNILSAFYRELIANEPETNRNARRWEY